MVSTIPTTSAFYTLPQAGASAPMVAPPTNALPQPAAAYPGPMRTGTPSAHALYAAKLPFAPSTTDAFRNAAAPASLPSSGAIELAGLKLGGFEDKLKSQNTVAAKHPNHWFLHKHHVSLQDKKNAQAKPEYDAFLEKWNLRRYGFLNELGVACQYIFGPSSLGQKASLGLLVGTWGGAIAYVAAHSLTRAINEHNTVLKETKDPHTANVYGVKEGLNTVGVQSIASLFGPVMVIERLQHLSDKVFMRRHAAGEIAKQSPKQLNALLQRVGADALGSQPEALPQLSNTLLQHSKDLVARKGAGTAQLFGEELLHMGSGLVKPFLKLAGRPVAHNPLRDTMVSLGGKILDHQAAGKNILRFMASKPGLAAFSKVTAGFIGIGVWTKVFDPIVEQLKHKVMNPVANHLAADYAKDHNYTPYTPALSHEKA